MNTLKHYTNQLLLVRTQQYGNLAILCVAAVVLIAMQEKALGWTLLGLGALHLWLCGRDFLRQIGLVYVAVAILGYTPITTDISYGHMLEMGFALLLAVSLPFLISRKVFGSTFITYPINVAALKRRRYLAWLLFTGALSIVVIPFYLTQSSAWHNWMFDSDTSSIVRLFIGTNALGIWDELFFINTVLALLRQHFSFAVANVAQAILFTSFLFELGFIAWAPLLIFPFALIQGYTFAKSHSLAYVIAIHLTIDFVLFISLITIRYPSLLPFI